MIDSFKGNTLVDAFKIAKSFCWRCAGTKSIWVTKEECKEYVRKQVIRHGFSFALSIWHNWKHEHTIPCPECQI
jgi:hypothetical protein